MLPTNPTSRTTPRRRPLLAISVAALLAAGALAGCSASGGSDSSDTTAAKKTTTTAGKTTTTEEETTTTEGSSSGDAPTEEELTSILPSASKVGEGWTGPTKSPASDTALSDAIKAQCPDASLGDDDSDPEVDVSYDNANGTNLEITFDRTIKDFTDAELDTAVAAVNKCTNVTYTDDSNGNEFVIDLAGQKDSSVGDQAFKFGADVKVTGTDGSKIEFYTYVYGIRRGPVGMTIQGTDGVADDGKVTDFDTDLLDSLGPVLDSNLKDLIG